LEILARRQQVAVFKLGIRDLLKLRDRLFWAALSSIWDRWIEAVIVVTSVLGKSDPVELG